MTPADREPETEQDLVAQGAIQLAVRASDMPPGGYVSSKVRHCSRCGARVRISDTSFPLADRLTIVCMVCFEAEWASELPPR